MVRENRIKDCVFPAGSLTGASTGRFDSYSDHAVNGRLQSIYFKAGNLAPAGSLFVLISGMGNESQILSCISGTTIGHHLGESWVVFPRATTVRTDMSTISGANGYNEFGEIWINSIIRVVGSGIGTGSAASGLTLIYIWFFII